MSDHNIFFFFAPDWLTKCPGRFGTNRTFTTDS